MSEHPLNDERIEMLSEPLMTEDGFVNEACLNQFKRAIELMPETYDRMAGEPEWTIKLWTCDIDILGGLAASAVQCFGGSPPNLHEVLEYTKVCLRRDVFKEANCDDRDRFRQAKLSLVDINRFLWDCLGELPQFVDWNDTEKYVNWIDLSAVLHNVCNKIRFDRRHCRAFDQKFEREHGESSDG